MDEPRTQIVATKAQEISTNILIQGRESSPDEKLQEDGVSSERWSLCLPSLPPLNIPGARNDYVDAFVSHVETATKVFLVMKKDLETMMEVVQSLNQYCMENRPPQLFNPKIGDPAAALFQSGKGWCRGIVMGRPDPWHIQIYFIDFGNTELVKKDKVKVLAPQFRNHPPFAVPAMLMGVRDSFNVEVIRNALLEQEVIALLGNNLGPALTAKMVLASGGQHLTMTFLREEEQRMQRQAGNQRWIGGRGAFSRGLQRAWTGGRQKEGGGGPVLTDVGRRHQSSRKEVGPGGFGNHGGGLTESGNGRQNFGFGGPQMDGGVVRREFHRGRGSGGFGGGGRGSFGARGGGVLRDAWTERRQDSKEHGFGGNRQFEATKFSGKPQGESGGGFGQGGGFTGSSGSGGGFSGAGSGFGGGFTGNSGFGGGFDSIPGAGSGFGDVEKPLKDTPAQKDPATKDTEKDEQEVVVAEVVNDLVKKVLLEVEPPPSAEGLTVEESCDAKDEEKDVVELSSDSERELDGKETKEGADSRDQEGELGSNTQSGAAPLDLEEKKDEGGKDDDLVQAPGKESELFGSDAQSDAAPLDPEEVEDKGEKQGDLVKAAEETSELSEVKQKAAGAEDAGGETKTDEEGIGAERETIAQSPNETNEGADSGDLEGAAAEAVTEGGSEAEKEGREGDDEVDSENNTKAVVEILEDVLANVSD